MGQTTQPPRQGASAGRTDRGSFPTKAEFDRWEAARVARREAAQEIRPVDALRELCRLLPDFAAVWTDRHKASIALATRIAAAKIAAQEGRALPNPDRTAELEHLCSELGRWACEDANRLSVVGEAAASAFPGDAVVARIALALDGSLADVLALASDAWVLPGLNALLARVEAQESKPPQGREVGWEARALGLLSANPDLTDAELARQVRKHRSTISRCRKIKIAREAHRDSARGRFARGYRLKGGGVEAYR